MNLVLIEPRTNTYTVFSDAKQVDKFKSDYTLTAEEVEKLRVDPESFFCDNCDSQSLVS